MSTHLLLRAFMRVQRRAGLCILIFHRVLERRDPLRPGEPTVAEFEARMRWLKDNFTVLPLSHAVRCLREDRLPRDALAITFDDGYADNRSLAAPLLSRLGLHATFFVAAGFLDGGRMFNDSVIETVRAFEGDLLDLSELGLGTHRIVTDEDRCAAISQILAHVKHLPPAQREERVEALADWVGAKLPTHLMMTSTEVRSLHSLGMGIGGHTMSHPILQSVDEQSAKAEISKGRKRLEDIVGAPITLFAYPNGRPGEDYGHQHVQLVKALGFEAAVSTAWGVCRVGADQYQLPRFTPWDRSDWRFGLRMIKAMTVNGYAQARGQPDPVS